MTDTLKQPQYLNYSVRDMIVLLLVSESDLIDKIPPKKVTAYNAGLLDYMRANHADVFEAIDPDKKVSEELRQKILSVADEYISCSIGDDGAEPHVDLPAGAAEEAGAAAPEAE